MSIVNGQLANADEVMEYFNYNSFDNLMLSLHIGSATNKPKNTFTNEYFSFVGSVNASSSKPIYSGTNYNYVIDDCNDSSVGSIWASGNAAPYENGSNLVFYLLNDAPTAKAGSVYVSGNIFNGMAGNFTVSVPLFQIYTPRDDRRPIRAYIYAGGSNILTISGNGDSSPYTNTYSGLLLHFAKQEDNFYYRYDSFNPSTSIDWTGPIGIGSGEFGFIIDAPTGNDVADETRHGSIVIDYVRAISGILPTEFKWACNIGSKWQDGTTYDRVMPMVNATIGNLYKQGHSLSVSLDSGLNYSTVNAGSWVTFTNTGSYMFMKSITSGTYYSGTSNYFVIDKKGACLI